MTYIENSTTVSGIGGSHQSLYTLLANLDRGRFDPRVLLYWGGNFVERLRALGVEVEVAGIAPPPWATPSLAPRAASRAPTISRVLRARLRPLRRLLAHDVPQARQLVPLLRRGGSQIVHTNDGVTSNADALLAARRLGIPLLCHERKIRRYDWVDRRLARSIDTLVCISEAVARNCRERGVRARRRDVMLPNAIDLSLAQPRREGQAVRAELGLRSDDLVVGMVANFVDWKRHADLVCAIEKLVPQIPRLRCVVAGNPMLDVPMTSHPAVAELIRCLGMQDHVHLLGFRADVPDILGACDIFVHPAEGEPFGRAVIEAMAARLPVVATRSGGPAEIVLDGETGLLVPVRDPEALAAAIRLLAADPANRRTMGERGRRRAEESYSAQAHAREIESIYEEIAGRLRRSRAS